jgi:hypothetical protein
MVWPNLSAPTFLELAADFRLRSGRQGHRVPDGISQMSSQLTHRWREMDSNYQSPVSAGTRRCLHFGKCACKHDDRNNRFWTSAAR